MWGERETPGTMRRRGSGAGEEKEREEGNGRQKQNKTNREPPEAGRRLPGGEGHVLLNEDLHQVDVAAGGRCVQGCPQLIVLGIHVGTMGKEQLDNLLKVVDAALRGAKGDRGRVSSRRAPAPGHASFPSGGHEKDGGGKLSPNPAV